MKRNMMQINLHRSIKNSIARYIAIMAIIALGAGIFVGLRTTRSDMIATGQQYMDRQNMFDLRLVSTCGWDEDHVGSVADMDGIHNAEGVYTLDVIAGYKGKDTESVYKLYSIPESVNKVYLHGGRMPKNPNECLADAFHATDDILGKEIVLSAGNETDTLDNLNSRTFTVVGYASTPLYMDMSRGNTTLGNGTVSAFLFLPAESFNMDYYSEIYVTLSGDRTVCSDVYDARVEALAEQLKPQLSELVLARYNRLKTDAEEAYAEGLEEYQKGIEEYQSSRDEAFTELDNARLELENGQKELDSKTKELQDGLLTIENTAKTLDAGQAELTEGRQTFHKSKSDAYAQMADAATELMRNYSQVQSGIDQINDGISQLDSGISQLQSGLQQLQTTITLTETLLDLAKSALDQAPVLPNDINAQANEKIAEYEKELGELKRQNEELTAQLAQLQAQKEALVAQRQPLLDAKAKLDAGLLELQASRDKAESEFAAAEATLDASQLQIDKGRKELDEARKKLEDGKVQLEQAEKELADGWKAYQEGYTEATQSLNEAWDKLEEGRLELQQARKTIDTMDEADVYTLDRNTNIGYLALDNNSEIVEGVSAVFPAFFLLIAALVCITTMTRMVEEERTQIGTLKALGYSQRAIIGKYLAYAGSAAVLGCGLGVLIGSVVFPIILWNAYQIIMQLGDEFVLHMDWPLCILVVCIYTAVTLAVTWYTCRRSLQEVPAELIRPKAPTSGKSIFLEKQFFWNRLSFLNKVMLRNIFRYRQRLVMMLIGIGGCTALLLTGFGIRDSIGNLADFQFDEIILYDAELRFTEDMPEGKRQAFAEEFDSQLKDIYFYHQSSMELSFEDQIADVTFLSAEEGMSDFIDFHTGKKQLSMPKSGEALISSGLAKRFSVAVGDTVTVRDSNMQELTLRVSGVFDNNVYNYVVTTPSTVIAQWDKAPQVQMACVYAADGQDVHQLGAELSSHRDVMSVTVSEDVRESVGNMLEALDLVVVTVVICASLLAIIVLYNLTNINITERLREIATIKVLGFRSGESAAYVFKENLLLSVMGALLGLGGGVLLLEFVISKIQVDMVWITARLLPMSFVWSVVITMLSALLVDFVLYFKLDKINMAEALKSIE